MSDEGRAIVEEQVRQFAEGLETSFKVKSELEYANDYPVLYNDPQVTELVKEALEAADFAEILETAPQPPSEDFAYYLKELPGTFFYVDAMPENGEWYPHHHPKFEINEDSLLISAKAMAAVVVKFCG